MVYSAKTRWDRKNVLRFKVLILVNFLTCVCVCVCVCVFML